MIFLLRKKNTVYKYILALFTLGSFSSSFACTDFLLVNEKKNVVVGRSMEFGMKLQSAIEIYPKNEKHTSILSNSKKGLSWVSKYAYIGVTSFGSNLIADGMNEKGLSIGTLWFPGAKYPKIPKDKPEETIAIENLSSWILGSFKNLDEVREGLENIYIWFHEIKALKEVPPIHLSLHDSSGKSMVIEFLNGKMHIIDNVVGVLTNTPKFEWQVTNLSNYVNLTAVNKKIAHFDGSVIDPTGEGSGLLGMPGDWTPPSRFVKISLLKEFVKKTRSTRENVNLAFHLLNTVDIPYGVIRSVDGKNFDHTQWIVVKDLSNKTFSYRTYKNLNIHTINLEKEITKLKGKRKKIKMIGAD
ncbi:MAG: Choloylglycine hydrolase [Candidatus Anoxychlamydiales bacterium]|nr:Choloylglycine hydrolase [Candidatus Anoxychlamydiales bacterium]NGX52555.1 Choloylglycine hydrolase [Candidatus Anoxychlamydiales bacterium]